MEPYILFTDIATVLYPSRLEQSYEDVEGDSIPLVSTLMISLANIDTYFA
jgi:hypothetical protein